MYYESPQLKDEDTKRSFPADLFYCLMLVHMYHGILQISNAISVPRRRSQGFFMLFVDKPQRAFLTIDLSVKDVFNRK